MEYLQAVTIQWPRLNPQAPSAEIAPHRHGPERPVLSEAGIVLCPLCTSDGLTQTVRGGEEGNAWSKVRYPIVS